MNPRNRNGQKNPFCVSYKKWYTKDNNKTAYWVGYAKIKSLDTDYFSKKVVDDVQATSNRSTFEQSASGRKNNPYLLQEPEWQEYEEANNDADVNSEAN